MEHGERYLAASFAKLKAAFTSDSEDETDGGNEESKKVSENQVIKESSNVQTKHEHMCRENNSVRNSSHSQLGNQVKVPGDVSLQDSSASEQTKNDNDEILNWKEPESDYDVISFEETGAVGAEEPATELSKNTTGGLKLATDTAIFSMLQSSIDTQPEEYADSTPKLGFDPNSKHISYDRTRGITNLAFEPPIKNTSGLQVTKLTGADTTGEPNMDRVDDTEPIVGDNSDYNEYDIIELMEKDSRNDLDQAADTCVEELDMRHLLKDLAQVHVDTSGKEVISIGNLAEDETSELQESHENDMQNMLLSFGTDYLARTERDSNVEKQCNVLPITLKDVVECLVDPMTNKVIGDEHDSGVDVDNDELFDEKVKTMLTKQDNTPVHRMLFESITDRIPVFKNILKAQMKKPKPGEVPLHMQQLGVLPGKGLQDLPPEEDVLLLLLQEVIQHQDHTFSEPLNRFHKILKSKINQKESSFWVHREVTLADYSHCLKMDELMKGRQDLLALEKKLLTWWRRHKHLIPEDNIYKLQMVAGDMCELSKQTGSYWTQYITKYDIMPSFKSQSLYNQEVESHLNKLHDFIAALLLQLRTLLATINTQKEIKEALKLGKVTLDTIDEIIMRLPTPYVDIYSD